MSIFLTMDSVDLNNTGFLDGSQKLIPHRTELEVTVLAGYFGYKKSDDAVMSAELVVVVSEPCEFTGQVYTWRPKVYDLDEKKADLARKNLALFDRHVGLPIISGGLPLNEETIAQNWANRAKAIAMFCTNEESNKKKGKTDAPINWISAFKYADPAVTLAATPAAPPVTLSDDLDF